MDEILWVSNDNTRPLLQPRQLIHGLVGNDAHATTISHNLHRIARLKNLINHLIQIGPKCRYGHRHSFTFPNYSDGTYDQQYTYVR